MSTDRETDKHTDLVLEVAPPEVGHLKIEYGVIAKVSLAKVIKKIKLNNPTLFIIAFMFMREI